MWRNQFRSVRNRGRIRPACGAANKWNKDRCDGGPIQLTRTTNQLCEDHPLRREDRTQKTSKLPRSLRNDLYA